ncbi:hypothetical protein [Microcystis sp. LEGE 08355]|uniref:hypothetical protein n=1 Tax=Microcystis sp. LEGE 08355 TaxID=1828687 RepID=UPI001881A4C4|nr:hypothetical protein [Microcystis sp. LEGE 08355]MBE9071478.1 hypothetical protein [Microcystis sp. LEGE 08355]
MLEPNELGVISSSLTPQEQDIYQQRIDELHYNRRELYERLQKQSQSSNGEFTAYGEEAIGGELL